MKKITVYVCPFCGRKHLTKGGFVRHARKCEEFERYSKMNDEEVSD